MPGMNHDQGEAPQPARRLRITATRKLGWDSAHRVLRHESKCSTLHGHRYTAEVTCYAEGLDDVGRVIDFGVIKEVVGRWVDETWDHTTLVNSEDRRLLEWCEEDADCHGKRRPFVFDCEPTAENIAAVLLRVGNALLEAHGSEVRISKVRLWETPNCYADAEYV